MPDRPWSMFLPGVVTPWIGQHTFQTGPFICAQLVQHYMPRGLKKHNVIPWDSPVAITNGAQDWSLVKLWISQCLRSISLHHFLSCLINGLRTNLNKKSFPRGCLFWNFSKRKSHKSNTGKFMLYDIAEVLQMCRGGIHMVSWLGKSLQK